ncbi:maleylacetoacetate isomerase [Acidiphilium sp. AL]|uniref:Maleylacetoacetate isomerase n=1 Tax=Acidiphilium iwatense TaxID=768198 RepID=A0ABS9DUW5_9PROT|nr:MULTISPECIES: maleylacetoacetate isomerase [Acidiphilium]MCF3945149.1 maleylacetoacetate isomerase [Acidiphilium iwatense]MCU4160178.1 maleylacetoacetate isomerase [Acidiphilium sp. AL]
MADPSLYGYFRSSAAYRVRIALNLKNVPAETVSVHLRKGEQRGGAHLALNPAGLVPVWREDDGFTLGQSLAIIEYLDELHPEPPLLPADPRLRAWTREIALTIACDIHPLGNLRVLERLTSEFGADAGARKLWYRHWMALGFTAIEARLAQTAGRHAVGDAPTLADICLVPQLYNARRFGLDLTLYPRLVAVDEAARALPAFAAAAPERQPDSE